MARRGLERTRWLAGALAGAALIVLAATAYTHGGNATRATAPRASAQRAGPLRVCADPNNIPFSNSAGQGFENRIAELIARDLHRPLEYTWHAQRRGFIRNTLNAYRCDLVIGIPRHDPMVLTTIPYYRSTYVFVYRADRGVHVRSFDDPGLRHMRIGLHLIGDDYNALPPGIALERRGLIRNVVGYSIYGDYAQPNPPARLIDAVAGGDVDVAVAWGPLAGYFAAREPVAMVVVPVSPPMAMPGMPFDFAISLGVRHADTAFADRLDQLLLRRRDEIRRILTAYAVPLVESEPRTAATNAALAARSGRAGSCIIGSKEGACE